MAPLEPLDNSPLAWWLLTMCALESALMATAAPLALCRARLTRPKVPVPST